MRRFITASILAILHLVPAAAPANAAGTFICRHGDQVIRKPQQKAFLVLADGYMDLVLSVKFEGAVSDFGWLVPLPSIPQMEPAAGPVFETLSRATQNPWIGSEPYRVTIDSSSGVDTARHFRLTHRHEISIDDVTLLEAGDGGALAGWLDLHGFVLPAGAQTVLDDYARRLWVLAAIRIDPGQADATTARHRSSGEIQPFLFRFATDRLVLPLGIGALGGHESDILIYILADKPLYPASTPGPSWEMALKPWQAVSYYISHALRTVSNRESTSLDRHELPPDHLRGVYGRLHHQTDQLWLTRCRAVLQPRDMVDLTFEAPEPATALETTDLRERVEMIGYLGAARPDGALPLLLDFLSEKEAPIEECKPDLYRHHEELRPGQDLRLALWALGELGSPGTLDESHGSDDPCDHGDQPNQRDRSDPRILDKLKHWTIGKPPLYRLDALKALHRIHPPAAATAAMDNALLDNDFIEPDRCMLRLYLTARDVIISDGQAVLLPRLRKYRNSFGRIDELADDQTGKGLSELSRGADAIVMAAACGDTGTQAEIFRWLRDDAASWLSGLNDGDTIASFRSTSDYPNELHPLTRLATGSGAGRLGLPSHHPATSALLPPLADRPEVLNAVLRRVANVDTLSMLARAFILASLSEPTPDDLAHLRRLWAQARTEPRRVNVQSRQLDPQGRCPQTAEFDLDACSVVYAMAQLGQAEEVWFCWRRVPWSESELKGEILVALLRAYRYSQPPPRLLGAATDYQRRVWNRRAAEHIMAECYDPKQKRAPGQWPYSDGFDIPHRRQVIADIVRTFPPDNTWQLLADVTLEPAVRLYWLSQSWDRLHRDDPDRLRHHLRAIKGRLRNPVLMDLCEQLETRLTGRARGRSSG